MSNDNFRFHIFASGLVQGVFFRGGTQEKARNLGIKGWVKNLPDGQVEIVAEGKNQALKDLLFWLKKGPAGAQVKDIEIKKEDYRGEFDGFNITRN